jgi:hypothetical protein
MLQLPQQDTSRTRAGRGALKAHSADPIFAAIAEHKRILAVAGDLQNELDLAEFEAAKTHGHRPIAFIRWRNYSAIGASEIDGRREEFLNLPDADPAAIEQEYLDAKARIKAKQAAGPAWDNRTGLAKQRRDYMRAMAAESRHTKHLALTKPTTPAGAAALLRYILSDDLTSDCSYWHLPALKSIAAALADMGPQP